MLLQIRDLHLSYGAVAAVHGVSIDIAAGEIVTLIGANGAGKTSLLHSLMRVPPPVGPRVTAGDILWDGKSLLGDSVTAVVNEAKVALVPEGRHIFGNLTVEQNLAVATYARRDKAIADKDRTFVYELFPRLLERRTQRSELLSGGEQQMLAIGRALMTGCRTLLLDEPSMGLAPALMYDLFRALRSLNAAGMTIFLIEQNAKLALRFAHRAYVMETGKIFISGTSKEVAENPRLHAAYLG